MSIEVLGSVYRTDILLDVYFVIARGTLVRRTLQN